MIRTIRRVFLFLLRLRIPPTISIFIVIRRYGASATKEVRKRERSARQLAKAELDENLLKRCYMQTLFPKFLNFKLYICNLKHSPVYKECQQLLLTNKVDYKKRKIQTRLKHVVDDCKCFVKCNASFIDFMYVKYFTECSSEVLC